MVQRSATQARRIGGLGQKKGGQARPGPVGWGIRAPWTYQAVAGAPKKLKSQVRRILE